MAIVAEVAVTRKSHQGSTGDAERIEDLRGCVCPHGCALQLRKIWIYEPQQAIIGAAQRNTYEIISLSHNPGRVICSRTIVARSIRMIYLGKSPLSKCAIQFKRIGFDTTVIN